MLHEPAVQVEQEDRADQGKEEPTRGPDEEPFRDSVLVSASRVLTVEEVLARHQAWRARQEAFVQTVVSSGSTVLTFDVPGFAGPVTITASWMSVVAMARHGSAILPAETGGTACGGG